ncbi:Stomatal closure-related actin-binding protein 1 [Glycine soja]|uniref:Stomatal closure-related actin-binding protein 1 n=1 Tax=Glycine soja TaxID=3848 RepID=A0A445FPI0_GLYSO|nr:Stomatal closure-related actin-binding protein 1 [Glycine soja]
MITSSATLALLPRSSPSTSRLGRIYALTCGFSPLRIVTLWMPMPKVDRVVGSGGGHAGVIGANNKIIETKDDPKVLSMKEVVARETAQLLEQHNHLSVRDLASKFEKGLAAPTKFSEEARLREAASLEKHVLLKKLRDALESLKRRLAGRNKDDAEDTIAMASEDAKIVDEERAFAHAESKDARAAVQRVEVALQEHERMSQASGKQDLEQLMREVQEARRIKMLHQPRKVMDMEHELRALRVQLAKKTRQYLRL